MSCGRKLSYGFSASWGPDAGSLYKIEKKNAIKNKERFEGPTGFAWNGDYTKFYVVDIVARVVFCYDYDKKNGEIGKLFIFLSSWVILTRTSGISDLH